MIHQDRQATANQHHQEKEIEEVTVTHPDRKSMRPCEVVRIYLRGSWNRRQTGHGDLNPRRRDYTEDRDADSDQDRRSNPDAKPAIRWIVDSSMCRIELDHWPILSLEQCCDTGSSRILPYESALKNFVSLWNFDDERLMLCMAGFKKECAENIYCEGRDACEFEHRGRRQH